MNNDLINELHNKLDAQDKIINTQALEIARLKEDKETLVLTVKTILKEKEELEKEKKYNTELMLCNSRFNAILTELEEWLKEKWYEIEPKGTGINFNCEYDSEEDYVRGMETKSKLDTLKNSLNKIQELKEKYK